MRVWPTLLIALVAAFVFAGCASQSATPTTSLSSIESLEVVAEIPGKQVTGVAVSPTGRIFVCFPNWREPHDISVAELLADGSLSPFPNAQWNVGPNSPVEARERFVCVQSVYADDQGLLWILDAASPRMAGIVPSGPKLVVVDLSRDTIQRVYRFGPDALRSETYLNDLRVDHRHGAAYITDSGHGGLIVLDLESGIARRVLDGHPSTRADPKVELVAGGTPLRIQGQPLRVHADGIALDREQEYLYWQALTGRTLYRIPTNALRNATLSSERRASFVDSLGPTCATDGMEIDDHGNVYFTDFQTDSIRSVNVRGFLSGSFQVVTVKKSPLLVWPDSLAWGPDGSLYISTSQIHRTDWFTNDGSMPTEPYRILRLNKHYPKEH